MKDFSLFQKLASELIAKDVQIKSMIDGLQVANNFRHALAQSIIDQFPSLRHESKMLLINGKYYLFGAKQTIEHDKVKWDLHYHELYK